MRRSYRPATLAQSDVVAFAAPYIREAIERLLTKRHVDRDCASLSKAMRPKATAAQRRKKDANLVGVGFGAKRTAGQLTGDLAVRVYVTRKIVDERLPRGVRVPKSINGVATDVIVIGRPVFHARPVELGASISRLNGGGGSVGCIVAKSDSSKSYFLTAAHVLALTGDARQGDEVVEPSDGASGSALIAKLEAFVALQSDGLINTMDAALAELVRKTDVTNRLPKIGNVNTPAMEPALFQNVRKFGFTTQHTFGTVTDVSAQMELRAASGRPFLYDQVVVVKGADGKFSEGGDSGALVVDALTNRPIGLIIGGKGPRTVITPLDRVLTNFNVTLVGT